MSESSALSASSAPSTSSAPHLKRSLGVVGLVLFGLSYMALGTVFTTYGIVNQLTSGHLPASYVVALVTMLFTAASYAAMVKRFPVAGSAYTYAQQSFGGPAGFLTGWMLMLDYLFIPMINYLILSLYVTTQFPSIPTWLPIIVSLLLVWVFNVLGINLANKVNVILIAVSAAAVLVFAILAIKTAIGDPNAPGLLDPFLPGSANFKPVFTGAAVLALSFLGFDAVSTLSEETKRPKRDIPRAIILTTLIGGVLFIFVSWAGARAFHLDDWSKASDDLINAAGVVLFTHVGGQVLAGVFVIATIAGCLGSALTGQVAVSRILYSMGRDGILPRPLGILSRRFKTPVVATTVVSVVALLALVLTLSQASFMISFGALAAFALVNLSTIRTYIFPKGGRTEPLTFARALRYGVLPLIGFALTIWLWTSMEAFTWVIGLSWLAVGFVILLAKTHGFRRPVPTLDFAEEAPLTETVTQPGVPHDERPLGKEGSR